MSNEMNTGKMPSTTSNLNVGAENKKQVNVDSSKIMAQGESKAREDAMNLTSGGKLMQPSNRDTYQ